MNDDEMACPDCAETIKAAAKVCRFCGYRVVPVAVAAPSAAVTASDGQLSGEAFNCPACAKPTTKGWERCSHCHVTFASYTGEAASWDKPPPSEKPRPSQTSFWDRTFDDGRSVKWGCMGSTLALVAAIGSLTAYCSHQRAEQAKADVIEQQQQQREAEAAYGVTVRDGTVCADGADGSNIDLVSRVKGSLRDPDSFEHEQTVISPRSPKGQYVVWMRYRARNGFGGFNGGYAAGRLGLVGKDNCRVIEVKIDR